MKILAIALARRSRFSPIFDLLRYNHEITLLAPDGAGETPGLRVFPFAPVRPTLSSDPNRTRDSFLGTRWTTLSASRPLATNWSSRRILLTLI
jgi:hypothetical protein